jgi:hypothetical protein
MTAEVAVLNKLAVALAADSAATLRLSDGLKVYNSVNKLFSLSRHHPVGVMVFGDAEVFGTPWETVVKAFRRQLGERSFPTLREYGEALMAFVEQTPLITEEIRTESFLQICRLTLRDARDQVEERAALAASGRPPTQAQLKQKLDDLIVANRDKWYRTDLVRGCSPADERDLLRRLGDQLEDNLDRVFAGFPLLKRQRKDLRQLQAAIALRNLTSRYEAGVVVAGFGEDEVYPSLVEYTIHGGVGPTLKRERATDAITATQPGMIKPYAEREVVDAFLTGSHQEIDAQIHDYWQTLTQAFPDTILRLVERFSTVPPGHRADLRRALAALAEAVEHDFHAELEQVEKQRLEQPIVRSVAVLPKDELAAMAESLVNLQSFRRRVSVEDVASVGGEIDVCVITKGDGLVWIKRKHYFDAEMNPDWLARSRRPSKTPADRQL